MSDKQITNFSNKRLALNIIILYVKLIVTIIISFWTSRLVLDALGASDYGLYNVVGGIVSMLNILGTSMIATSYRYMAVELGKGEKGNPNRIFNTISIIHFALALFLVLIGETLGVYYINNFLVVEPDKINDALFVLHLSLVTAAFTVISIPTNGLIVARERFLFTSIIEIINAVTKLVFILLLATMDGDRLRYYAIMIAIAQAFIPLAYQIYCRVNDKEVTSWNLNKKLSEYKEILLFSWWMLLGAVACIARVQGAAMVINLFFGTVLNAAFGLANQVFNATSQFTTTLRQAAIPQIMKTQASGDGKKSINIVLLISKYTYLFMLMITVPLIAAMKGSLQIWLGSPPPYTDIFIILFLINGMLTNLSAGFDATIQASGEVKTNQIGYSIINLSLIPIIFILYKFGLPPYINVVVMIVLTIVTLIFQCWIMTRVSVFVIKDYICTTIIPAVTTTLFACIPSVVFPIVLDTSIKSTIIAFSSSFIWATIVCYFIGTSQREKQIVINLLSSKLLKHRNS